MAAENDVRFQRMHTDPRFKKLPRAKLKVPIDDRFRHMLTDKAFVDPFGIDKRGKPPAKKKKKAQHTMQRYYRFEGDDDAEKAQADKTSKEAAKSEEEESDDDDEQEDENVASSSESSSESSDSDDSSSSSEAEEEEDTKVATTDKETRRLAVVNMDWSCVKAVDLLVLFNSFIPKGGSVTSVAVYPSTFGLEQMKQEELQGPTVFQSKRDESDDDEAEVDVEKLRQYEKSKLRYYFAVVTCDSPSTASVLYNSCDGMEFERTSNILDLQFIPDDMQFNVEARDAASEVVAGYEAPDYQTRALQLSNVKLTWDDDEPVRVKQLRRRFNADELAEMDYKAYIASDDDDDEDEADESKANKLRSLLLGDAPDVSSRGKSDVDMEITFPSGLDELSKKYLENKRKEDETVWEARLRKQREKKAEKKKGRKESRNKTEDDEDGFNDPFFDTMHEPVNSDSEQEERRPKPVIDNKKKTTEEKKRERETKREEEGRSKAELELLLLNERDENVKRKGKESESNINEMLSEDPRFSALFNSHHFAVDPTDPRFKRSAAKLRVIAEMQQKRFVGDVDESGADAGTKEKSKMELTSMVKSLKRKARK